MMEPAELIDEIIALVRGNTEGPQTAALVLSSAIAVLWVTTRQQGDVAAMARDIGDGIRDLAEHLQAGHTTVQ